MSNQFSSWVNRALISLIFILGGMVGPVAHAVPTATIQTDRGCGGSARYVVGELITFHYSVSENAVVTLTLTAPDGSVTRPVFQQTVAAGATRSITGIAGGATGPRQLLLNATSASGSVQVECIYHVDSGTPQPPPGGGQLTASVTTNRGCGPNAVFQFGETSVFRVTVSHTALVTLRLRYPDGSIRTLLLNEPVAAGSVRTITGVVGNPPGQRLLILDATAGGQTAHAECAYTGGAGQPPPPGQFTASVTTDRGCGPTAVYQFGETSVFRVTVSQTAFVTLRLRYPDGSVRTLLFNEPVAAGSVRTITGVIGNPPGQRLLILDATAGSQTAHAECAYTSGAGQPPPGAALSLSVDRQCGGTYRVGQPVLISYRSSTSTFVTLFIRYADGNGRAILVNQPVVAGQTYTITGVAGLPLGARTLTLQGPSGGPAVTCSYTVVP